MSRPGRIILIAAREADHLHCKRNSRGPSPNPTLQIVIGFKPSCHTARKGR
jgi:hypothetical protein